MRVKESIDFHTIHQSSTHSFKRFLFQMRAEDSSDYHPIHQSSTHFINGYISIRDHKKALTFIQITNPPIDK